MASHWRRPRINTLVALALGGLLGANQAASGEASQELPRGAVLAPDVVREISEARQHPKAYAMHLRSLLGRFRGKLLVMPGRIDLRTKEGEPAVREAITFLEQQKPLAGISFSRGLALAAQDHAADQGPKGATGHEGTHGETMGSRVQHRGRFGKILGEDINYGPGEARDIVVDLIIDDGVPGRGHRQNIFNPRFQLAGAAIGPHAIYQYMCVIDFADAFTER